MTQHTNPLENCVYFPHLILGFGYFLKKGIEKVDK